MKKIAVFGKPANGKSTLSKNLAVATGIKLYALDTIIYSKQGHEIDLSDYHKIHDAMLSEEKWIIEGFAPFRALDSFYQRLAKADTLIYIDLPYYLTYWLVIKRLLKGIIKKPEGWPEGSSIFQGTKQTFNTLQLCPKFWNDDFLQQIQAMSLNKNLYVIRSLSELNTFIKSNLK